MNRDETIAFFEACEAERRKARGKAIADGKSEEEAYAIGHEAAKAKWNGWAERMLAERKAMEEDGRWAARLDWKKEVTPLNGETQAWLQYANVDFSCCCFTPSLQGEISQNRSESELDGALLLVSVSESFFDFSGFRFPGRTNFFASVFLKDCDFTNSIFYSYINFSNVKCFGRCLFVGVHFYSRSTFEKTLFFSYCDFFDVVFNSSVGFTSTIFHDFVGFWHVKFSGYADFQRTAFRGDVNFRRSVFLYYTNFRDASFYKYTTFNRASFSDDVSYENVYFYSSADFNRVIFLANVNFEECIFRDETIFELSEFRRNADFSKVNFAGPTSFYAVKCESGMSLIDARFYTIPNFIQAHFEEAPRFDSLAVRSGRYSIIGDPEIPARWRALKRLATQAHDQDREHEFFARELRSNRFLHDWPWPHPPWTLNGWFSFGRFWAGVFYGLFSNYGRSLLLPGFWWLLGVAVAAMFYLGQSEGMEDKRAAAGGIGLIPYATTLWTESWADGPHGCYVSGAQLAGEDYGPSLSGGYQPTVQKIGLSRELRAQTDAPTEAIELALRDGFLILYGDADTAHRIYGCLYGIELYGGGTPVAIMPPDVAFWSAIHKLWSAVMIFLFGLALRNMLKLK